MSKERKAKKRNAHFEIPMVAIHNNIVFSKNEVWAYYKIPTFPYENISVSSRIELANKINVAFSSLVGNQTHKVDCHLLITNVPFDINSWTEQMRVIYQAWHGRKSESKEFYNFLYDQAKLLEENYYVKRVVYLGVKLFTRGSLSLENFNILEFGVAEAWQALKNSFSSYLQFTPEAVSSKELDRAVRLEKDVSRILENSILEGVKVSSEELLLTTKRILHPYMPSPYLDISHSERIGRNDIELETVSVIEDNYRYLKITQFVDGDEYQGFRATLSFSKFPQDTMGEPSKTPPFIYFLTQIGTLFNANARFSLLPYKDVKKKLDDKKAENDDELKNFAQSGQRANSTLYSNINDIDALESELEENKEAWIQGSFRVTVEGNSITAIKDLVTYIKQNYGEHEINLTWTTGDQMDLLYEELPGGTLRINSFNQTTNLAMITTSGFNYGVSVGDKVQQRLVGVKGR